MSTYPDTETPATPPAQPTTYSADTVRPGQVWQERGGEGERYTVTEVGTHGAKVAGSDWAVAWEFFAHCTLVADAR